MIALAAPRASPEGCPGRDRLLAGAWRDSVERPGFVSIGAPISRSQAARHRNGQDGRFEVGEGGMSQPRQKAVYGSLRGCRASRKPKP
jgi:hypothetical protein